MKRILFIIFALLLPANLAFSVDLDFGAIEYLPNGGDLNNTLDPITGSITCNNSSSYVCEAFGTPGSTVLTGSNGAVVDISCRGTARISNGAATFDVGRSEIYITGQAKTRCRGLNSVEMTHTISGNPTNDTLYWGGRLKVRNASGNISGTYTTNGGGNSRPQRIRLVFI